MFFAKIVDYKTNGVPIESISKILSLNQIGIKLEVLTPENSEVVDARAPNNLELQLRRIDIERQKAVYALEEERKRNATILKEKELAERRAGAPLLQTIKLFPRSPKKKGKEDSVPLAISEQKDNVGNHHTSYYNGGKWICCGALDQKAVGCQSSPVLYHPDSFESYHFPCCKNQDRRSEGCKTTKEKFHHGNYTSHYDYGEDNKNYVQRWSCCDSDERGSRGCEIGRHPKNE